jgi:hypothetical protein
MGTVAWQPAPDPPRTGYRIHGHSASTIAIPVPAASWNVSYSTGNCRVDRDTTTLVR